MALLEYKAAPWLSKKKCVFCGRDQTQAVLNLEGFIHHNTPICCVNRKTCAKIQRKNKLKFKKGETLW